MHEIQYSLKRNALYQTWKNTTGSKEQNFRYWIKLLSEMVRMKNIEFKFLLSTSKSYI